jgi:hypothetical protein
MTARWCERSWHDGDCCPGSREEWAGCQTARPPVSHLDITVHEMGTGYKNSGRTVATIKYDATFTGKSGPAGTSEFFTGVKPGMRGTAARKIYSADGSESWSFSIGGAWLVCDREDLELNEPE